MIFLEPESSFPVDVVAKGKGFAVVDGGPYVLRTATGREFAGISEAFRRSDADAIYKALERHVVAGIPPEKIGLVHPDAAALLLAEVIKRSRVSEDQRGN